jgi:hypothetical protein
MILSQREVLRSSSELDEISRLLSHPKVGELSKMIDAVNPKRETTRGKAIMIYLRYNY